MATPEPIPGYVRCGVTHIGADWTFGLMSDRLKVAVVTITVDDGEIDIGLNREAAKDLMQKLELFLRDWPEDQQPS